MAQEADKLTRLLFWRQRPSNVLGGGSREQPSMSALAQRLSNVSKAVPERPRSRDVPSSVRTFASLRDIFLLLFSLLSRWAFVERTLEVDP